MSDSWRVGSKVPLNVYENDRPMFQCHAPEDASRVVDLLNSALTSCAELAASEKARDQLRESLEHYRKRLDSDSMDIIEQSAQITALQLREMELTEALRYVYDENLESNYSCNRYSIIRKALDSTSTESQERARKLEKLREAIIDLLGLAIGVSYDLIAEKYGSLRAAAEAVWGEKP